MREAHAARILTVVLATAGLSACSGSVDTTSTGGAGGSTGTGGSTGGGDAGVYDAPGDGIISDAVPPPLECSVVKDGQMIGPTATVNGGTLSIQLVFKDYVEGAQGWNGTPGVTAAPELGTVASVTVQGTTLNVDVTLAPGAASGVVTLTGNLDGWGPPPSYGTVTCPVQRVFKVDLGDGGPPMIAERAPAPRLPLEQRPRLALTLVRTEGLRAEVRAVGVPEGASVELETTGGVAHNQGGLVDWALPAEPGLYQLEVVVRRGGSIATSALALEVKDAAG
jgi:hypothetical protein